jgi:5'(3')-deoxyribonucleotidase
MKICVDIDGVLCDIHHDVLKYISMYYDVDIKVEDINDFNFVHGKSGIQFGKEIKNLLHNKNFVMSLPTVPGAVDAIRELTKHNLVVLATHRTNFSHDGTRQWFVDRFGLQLPIYYTKEIKADVLIDDYPKYIEEFRTYNDNKSIGILFDRPWNRAYKTDFWNIERVYDWAGVLDSIRRTWM